jgi:D-galactose 1-dehydrogenase
LTSALHIGLVGLGKIARDQHLPAIAGTARARLVAVASRNATAEGVAHYPDIDTLLAGASAVDAVVLCQPPQVRYDAARRALMAGKHVFLEKPPGTTVSEVEALAALAQAQGVSLFASWHSRYAPAVEPARAWLHGQALRRVSISWKEDVRHWHPGQAWIWQAGGFGVFDPGINALSILTRIVDEPIVLAEAAMEVPANREAPIAARLRMNTASGAPVDAVFDWRQTGPQTWDIAVETASGHLLLSHGGSRLSVDGVAQAAGAEGEYPAMYRHFLDLVEQGRSDVDVRPLQLVADAFLCGRRQPSEPFADC